MVINVKPTQIDTKIARFIATHAEPAPEAMAQALSF